MTEPYQGRGGFDMGEAAKRLSDKVNERKAFKKIEKAKLAGRSELKLEEWRRNRLAGDPQMREILDVGLASQKDNVQRISYRDVTPEQFERDFELTYTPCVITGAMDDWRAWERWTPLALYDSIGHVKLKCGEDDDENPVKLRFKYFLHYMCVQSSQMDDSPLYVFDRKYCERNDGADRHKDGRSLLDDYKIPCYFTSDLFKYAGEGPRPPYRWFVIGPERSGTGIHIDPLATSAWNALVYGHKRWVLFPPGVPQQLVKPKPLVGDREAATWYRKVYPLTQDPSWTGPKPLEILQRPGEIVFVPGGWWHVVINIGYCAAVTQNFASEANFPVVWKQTLQSRPKFARHWLKKLEAHRPDLARVARLVGRGKYDFGPCTRIAFAESRRWLTQHNSSPSSSSSTDYSNTSDNSFDDAVPRAAVAPHPHLGVRMEKRCWLEGGEGTGEGTDSDSDGDNGGNGQADNTSRRKQKKAKAKEPTIGGTAPVAVPALPLHNGNTSPPRYM